MQLATISKAEKIMQEMPQVDCPVVHRFGDGIYIREVTMLTGTLAIGHTQKYPQNNFLLKGKVAMFVDGGVKVLEAPMFFVGEAGRKMGLVLETVVWQNIWPTDETDIDKLEEMYLDKSPAKQDELDAIEYVMREVDRQDYDAVKEQVENESDQVSMPSEWSSVITRRSSNISGDGMFLTWPIEKDGVLGPARLDGKRTQIGRYTNHSMTPNAKPELMDNGDIYLVAIRDISGCKGGSKGEEITVDYRDMLGVEL